MTISTSSTASVAGSSASRRPWWSSSAILVVGLGLLLIGRGTWEMGQALPFATGGATAEAQVIGITSVHEGRGRMARYADVRYVFAGRSFRAVTEDRIADADVRPGARVTITYLPADPRRVRLNGGSVGFWPWFTFGAGIVVSLAGLAWLLHRQRQP